MTHDPIAPTPPADRVSQPHDLDPAPGRSISRRSLLAGAAVGGAATLLPGVAEAARHVTAATAKPTRVNAIQFFSNPDLNYAALAPLSAAAYRSAEVGEVLTVFNRVHARGDTYRAYYDEFLAEGRRMARGADAALKARHRVTARDRYLRAATYLDQALFYVLASDHPTRAQEASVYRQMERAFAAAGQLFDPAFERVAIPYDGRTLPGWLVKPPGSPVRRPTLILNNGSDGQNIDMYVFGAQAAIERGFNALIFEGPGQGSNLFLHGIPFRPDWEKVITPVVNFLRGHPGVDQRRIVLSGSSFGGYLVPRAAAFEHRLAALVVDPGVTNTFVDWQTSLPKQMLTWLAQGKRTQFNQFWKQVLPHLGQSQTLMHWLTAHPKRGLPFRIAEGARFHCEAMAPTVRNDAVLDWVQDHMRPTS
jgi:TAT (twin-arginine translocation) pathway signal sequence/Esterase FrsA-like